MKLKAGQLSFKVPESGSGEPALLFLHYWGWIEVKKEGGCSSTRPSSALV